MMQKNLSCKNKSEAQKNMYWFSFVLVPINLIFLSLGAILYLYSQKNGINIPIKADMLYPTLATQGNFPVYIGVIFIIGLIASAYSSADSALTSLTTSFSIDILHIEKRYNIREQVKKRKQIHILFSFILLIVILVFNVISKESVVKELFTIAGYTYGPLLGLYSFGLFTNYQIKDKLSIYILLGAIFLSYITKILLFHFYTYSIGFEILILNGVLSFIGLWLIRKK
jgi:Na+/proline symporter